MKAVCISSSIVSESVGGVSRVESTGFASVSFGFIVSFFLGEHAKVRRKRKERMERCISVFFVAVFVGLVVIAGAHSVSDGVRTCRHPLSKVPFYEAAVAGEMWGDVGSIIVFTTRLGSGFGRNVGVLGSGGVECHFIVGRYRFLKWWFPFQESAMWIFQSKKMVHGPTHGKGDDVS